jgi:hypothetical protein
VLYHIELFLFFKRKKKEKEKNMIKLLKLKFQDTVIGAIKMDGQYFFKWSSLMRIRGFNIERPILERGLEYIRLTAEFLILSGILEQEKIHEISGHVYLTELGFYKVIYSNHNYLTRALVLWLNHIKSGRETSSFKSFTPTKFMDTIVSLNKKIKILKESLKEAKTDTKKIAKRYLIDAFPNADLRDKENYIKRLEQEVHSLNVRNLENLSMLGTQNALTSSLLRKRDKELRELKEAKCEIASKRESTAMNTARKWKQRAKKLSAEVGLSETYATIKRIRNIFKDSSTLVIDINKLKAKTKELGHTIHKIKDVNYGYVNAYHSDVWLALYNIDLAELLK